MAPEPDDTISVLVVDDHAVVRRGLLAFLDSEPDLEVVGDADGGTQALDLLARLDAEGRRPDVVLMDLQMEPLDGIESTRQVRARYDDVEVVALTSFAEEERVHGGPRGRRVRLPPQGRRRRRGRGGRAGRSPRRAAARSRRRAAPDVVTARGSTRRADARSSRRVSSRSCGSWARAGRTRRSPPSCGSASGRPGRTCRTSCGKLGLSSRTQAALWAVREGLVEVT